MWPKDVNIYPTKEDRQVGYKHLKRYCTSYITREMQIFLKKSNEISFHTYYNGQNLKH